MESLMQPNIVLRISLGLSRRPPGAARCAAVAAVVAVAVAVAVAAGAGCGAGAGGAGFDAGVPFTDAHQPATTGRYIPLALGATWTWKASDSLTGASGTTSSTVEALETLTGAKSGISAFRVHSTTLSGATVNWQQDTGTAIVRHREQFLDASGALQSDHVFTPGKLRLDETPAHQLLNATWVETYTDVAAASTMVTVNWTVEAVDESVTVPAGTFTCLRLHSVESGAAGFDSHFWYARNVGKVKESGTEIRDLIGYYIP
jgi:hypothetical protein